MSIVKEAVDAAVEWWVAHAGAGAVHRDGTGSVLRAFVAGSIPGPTGGQLAAFGSELRERLYAALLPPAQPHHYHTILRTDYEPEGILADAATHAGIVSRHLPCKTVMWIKDDVVTVRHGYGAETYSVWSREGVHVLAPAPQTDHNPRAADALARAGDQSHAAIPAEPVSVQAARQSRAESDAMLNPSGGKSG